MAREFAGTPAFGFTLVKDVLVGRQDLPRVLNQQSAKRLLKENGWTETLGGKHSVKMTKPGHRPITLPQHGGQDYSRDLADRILRQAGLKGASGS